MIVNLNRISKFDGAKIDVKCSLDLSICDDSSFSVNDIVAEGDVTNSNGEFVLNLKLLFTVNFLCARCLGEFSEQRVVVIDNTPVDSDFVDEFNQLDLSSLTESEIWSDLPIRFLCRNDCTGLCDSCGRIISDCACSLSS